MMDVARETRIAALVEIEQPQAVVWDVDGVLIDSEPLHYEAVSNALSRSSIFLSEAENTILLGLSLPQVWLYLNEHGLQDDCEAWIHKVEDYYTSRVDAALARPETRRLVAELFRRGIPQACVSTAGRRLLDANLSALGITKMIQHIVAREDVARTKPNPEPYVCACQLLGVRPSACLAIEDTPVGVAAARAAGIPVVAWPHALTMHLDFSLANARIDNLKDVSCFARFLIQDGS